MKGECGVQITLLLLGLLLVTAGIAVKKNKWIWFHQGLYKRPVDPVRYCKYMGLADFVFGLIYLLLFLISFRFFISSTIISIVFVCYVIVLVYGENKYKIKEDHKNKQAD